MLATIKPHLGSHSVTLLYLRYEYHGSPKYCTFFPVWRSRFHNWAQIVLERTDAGRRRTLHQKMGKNADKVALAEIAAMVEEANRDAAVSRRMSTDRSALQALQPHPALPKPAVPLATPAAAVGAAPSHDDEGSDNKSRCTGQVKPVDPDGDCMFSASLSELKRLGVARDRKVVDVHQLRSSLLDWVSRNGDAICAGLTISQWIEFETGETLAGYERRMRRRSEWGGVVELYALTQVFGISVSVWEPAGSDGSFARRHRLAGTGSVTCNVSDSAAPSSVHLFYNGINHYNVFVPDKSRAADEASDGASGEVSDVSDAGTPTRLCSPTPEAAAEAPHLVGRPASGVGASGITKARPIGRPAGSCSQLTTKKTTGGTRPPGGAKASGSHTKHTQAAPPRRLSEQRRGRSGLMLQAGKLQAVLSFRMGDSPRRSARPQPQPHEVRV